MNLKNCLQKIIKKPKSNIILCFLVLIILFFLFIGNYNLIEGNRNDDTDGINKIIDDVNESINNMEGLTNILEPMSCQSDDGNNSTPGARSSARISNISNGFNESLSNSQGTCANNYNN